VKIRASVADLIATAMGEQFLAVVLKEPWNMDSRTPEMILTPWIVTIKQFSKKR
jgi:hypothetical protein